MKMTKFLRSNKSNLPVDTQIKSMQCTAYIDADILTAVVGTTITLTARVDPPGPYSINFKIDGITINPIPIITDPSGIATLPFDTTGQSPGTHDITVDVINPTPPPDIICSSQPLQIALTTTLCAGITIDTLGPITAYIGDSIPISATATITEASIIEFVDSATNNRFGSCLATPPIPGPTQCTANLDTTGASPDTYSVVAKVGNGSALQCISSPIYVTLQEPPGKIVAISIPPGASIWYDGSDTGIKSSAIISDVLSGTHDVVLKLSGFNDYTESSITIGPGETYTFFAILAPTVPPAGIGDLNITSTPDGAGFGLYTGETGTAPTTLSGLAATYNAYEADGVPGYTGVIGSIYIKPSTTTNLNIILQPEVANAGLAIIESIPTDADIYIDGLPTGAKTSYASLFAPGSHDYELRLSGYVSKSGPFTVVSGTDIPAIVSETLQPVSGASVIIGLMGIAALGFIMMSNK